MAAAILSAALGNLLVATVLAAAAYVVGLRSRLHVVAYGMWLLVLVKLVTPPLVTVPVRVLPARAAAAISIPSIDTAAAPFPGRPSVAPAPPMVPKQALEPVSPENRSAIVAAPPPREIDWPAILLILWLTGSGTWTAVAVVRVRRFNGLLRFSSPAPPDLVADVVDTAGRIGLRRPPVVRLFPGGAAPFVWAVGRPTVFFPAGLLTRVSREQRLTLLAHELAHLHRRDHLVRWIEAAVLAAWWWCPLAWLARRELRRLEEEACDAEVAAVVPGSGHAYAAAILETLDFMAGASPTPALASGLGNAASLRRRLMFVLDGRAPLRLRGLSRVVFLLSALSLLAVNAKPARVLADRPVLSPTVLTGRTLVLPIADIVAADDSPDEPIQFLPTPNRIAISLSGQCPAAAITADGQKLAIADGSTVVVQVAATGQIVARLAGQAATVNAVAFSPDGARIATASQDGLARLWDADSGEELHTLTGHGSWVLAVAFSPDGRTLVTGGYDKAVRVWDAATGEPLAAWTGHTAGVRAVAFSPDGRIVASGGADHSIRLWNVATGTVIHTLRKHTGSIRAVAFFPDGARLATGSEDGTLRLWDPATGREVGPPVALPDFVTALGVSPRGGTLLAGSLGGHLLNVDPATGQPRGFLGVEPGNAAGRPAHPAAVTAILTAAGGMPLTLSQDGTILVWPSTPPPQRAQQVFRAPQPVAAVALSPDGQTLATGGRDGKIRLWDAATARDLGTLPGHPGGVSTLVFAPGGRLVSAGADERVCLWDVTTGRADIVLTQRTADLRIALSLDGRTLAIGGLRLAGVTLVDMTTGVSGRRIAEAGGEVTAVSFTPAGDRLATGDAGGSVRVWDLASGEERAAGRLSDGRVDGLAFGRDGTAAAIVNGGDSQPVHAVVFWDLRDGSAIDVPRPLEHAGPVTAAAFAGPDRLLTVARDGNLYSWDLRTSQVSRTMRCHFDAVSGLAVAADGSALFSAGDRSAKRWPPP